MDITKHEEAKAGTCIHCGADPQHARAEHTIANEASYLTYLERMARAYQETALHRADLLRGVRALMDGYAKGETEGFVYNMRALLDGY